MLLSTVSRASSASRSTQKALKGVRRKFSATFNRGFRQVLPDRLLLLLLHLKRVGRVPNLDQPSTFNEIVLDRCLNPDPKWTALTDKLLVRDYVKSKVGEQHLIPLLAAPEVFTRDVFDALPNAFVMKANHGCGFIKVIRNKAETSYEQLRQLSEQWLATDFYRATREKHYQSIERKVYFESLLLDSSGKIPADYKLNIFGRGPDGPIIYTGVITDRFGSPRHDFYDPEWNRLDIELGGYPCSTAAAPPLPHWNEVVRVATQLAEGLGYVRVDLYAPDDRVLFGELTFTPGAGIMRISPERYDREWGQLIREMEGTREHASAMHAATSS